MAALTTAIAAGGCSPARCFAGHRGGLCLPAQGLFWESCRKGMKEDVLPVLLGKSAGYQKKRQVLSMRAPVSTIKQGEKSTRWETQHLP